MRYSFADIAEALSRLSDMLGTSRYNEMITEVEHLGTFTADLKPGQIATFAELDELLEKYPAKEAMRRISIMVEQRTVDMLDSNAEKMGARNKQLFDALKALLADHDQNTCLHENRHRGGVLWTICDDCGVSWADDRGGFQPRVDRDAVREARNIVTYRTPSP